MNSLKDFSNILLIKFKMIGMLIMDLNKGLMNINKNFKKQKINLNKGNFKNALKF